jgi:phage terminase small subunit
MDELTPKQQTFLAGYLDPQSPTWNNAYQSALKAGYTEEYASNITGQMPNWLSEAISENSLVTTALRNLCEALEGDDKTIKWDATKFTLKGLKSDKFSEKTKVDHTTNGKDLPVPILATPDVLTHHSNKEDSGVTDQD